MNFKRFVQDYFTFSRNERKGITILLILIFLLAIANNFLFYFEKPARIETNLLDSASRELGLMSDSLNRKILTKKYFTFNPNTIDSIALDSLDLPDAVKFNLLKFRSRGGKIYSDSDFRKIYGVTEDVFSKIEPYLKVELKVEKPDLQMNGAELFLFDPNTASDIDFQRLGLTGKQVETIRNYQSKGGKFRTKEDFSKIWGISNSQKKALSEYIVFEENDNLVENTILTTNKILIELNSADSIALELLPGIADKLSKRIVKYRDILGGFYTVNQLKEVYGISDQTFILIEDKLTLDVSKIKKLNLNFSDVNELSKHPYLKKNLARQIVNFRTKNGKISDLSVLRDSMILNIDEYNRLKPYF